MNLRRFQFWYFMSDFCARMQNAKRYVCVIKKKKKGQKLPLEKYTEVEGTDCFWQETRKYVFSSNVKMSPISC